MQLQEPLSMLARMFSSSLKNRTDEQVHFLLQSKRWAVLPGA